MLRLIAPNVSNSGPDDTLGSAEESLRKPESAHPEGGLLRRHLRLEQLHRCRAKIADLKAKKMVETRQCQLSRLELILAFHDN